MSGFIAFAIFAAIITICFTVYLLRLYARPKMDLIVHATVFFSWVLVFMSLSWLIPLDLLPDAHDSMKSMWGFIYWTSFWLTWLIIPILQGFYDAGEFTFKDRLVASLKFNLKFYAIVTVLLVVFMVYIMIKNDFNTDQMLGFIMVLGNTWGLFLSVLLLGYGLVEIPRRFWYKGDRPRRLNELYFMAASRHHELEEAKERVLDAIDTVREIERKISTSDPLRYYFDKVIAQTPLSETIHDHARIGDFEQSPVLADIRIQDPTKETLAVLNYHVKASVKNLSQCEMAWIELMDTIDRLEYQVTQKSSPTPPIGGYLALMKWKYSIHWKGPIYRVLGVFFSIISAILVWSEMTMFLERKLSPFAVIVHYVDGNASATVFWAMLPLIYLTVCALYSLFRLRLMNFYNMHGHNRTDEDSLLFNATYALRIIGPIGYNFLTFMRVRGTAFQEVISGNMDVVPYLGTEFTRYFPIIIGIFCALTLFNVFSKILSLLGMEVFEHSEESRETVREGKLYVRKARRTKQTRTRKYSKREGLLHNHPRSPMSEAYELDEEQLNEKFIPLEV